MPLDNQRPISNNFNRNAEQDVQNRISPYDLTKDEKEKVWQIVDERNNNMDAERKDYRDNWKDRVDTEKDKIRGQQQPQPQLTMGDRKLPTQEQVNRLAIQNVQREHLGKIRGYEHSADKQINQVLDNAKEQGRGPQSQEQQQNRTLTQEFNHQANRDR